MTFQTFWGVGGGTLVSFIQNHAKSIIKIKIWYLFCFEPKQRHFSSKIAVLNDPHFQVQSYMHDVMHVEQVIV